MNGWQEDLLRLADVHHTEEHIFKTVATAARSLGFEYCAYGLRLPLPMSNPTIITRNNYSADWQRRYAEACYLGIDPSVLHASKSQNALVWTDAVFSSAPKLWDEAKSAGLRFGWSQSSFDTAGVSGMLSLSRSSEALTPQELDQNELKMRWLVQISHMLLSRSLAITAATKAEGALTEREVEVLKWTADGKTSGEISDILSISENTINFHVKNAIVKLGVVNKTAAVVRAAMLGLLC
jgi:LuxR family transcriptional regulator